MTLYKHLGPITFESETEMFEVFSTSNETLILQFKNYQDVIIEEIAELVAVYQLILKEEKLLEIYTQKNKSSSILVHRAACIGFENINIQLLCKIIKETIVSIFHSTKLISGKIGEITKEMFFQINGELRYLYFPVKKYDQNSKNIVSDVLQFFSQLKDDKEISHRLLLKKISKCITLEEILDETEYFLNIYHARQSSTFASNFHQNNRLQESLIGRTLAKSKFGAKNFNQNTLNEYRKSNLSGQTTEIVSSKNSTRRKYNLFKNSDSNNFKTTLSPQHNFSSSTWRKTKKQNFFQTNTFRTNSRAVHIELSQKNYKNQSISLFNRAASLNQTPKKVSNSKRKNHGYSLHSHQKNHTLGNQSMLKNKNQNFSKRSGIQENFEGNKTSQLKESAVSRNLNQSQCIIKYEETKNAESSWMKQMVNNSLEKWRQKSNQKGSIFNKIKDKDREGSTQVDSRSKIVEKYESPTYNILHESNASQIHPNKFSIKNESYLKTNQQSYQVNKGIGSQKKLKRVMTAKCSNLVEAPKNDQMEQIVDIQKSPEELQFSPSNQFAQPSNYPLYPQTSNQSVEQIHLYKSSIQHLAMKNKQEELRLNKNFQRKKTSIKEISQNKNLSRNVSDESETQRIQYSRYSKKNIKPEVQQNLKQISLYKNEIQVFETNLSQIFAEKAQIDHIAVAVVQTNQHLKTFESIFWKLPMFFLYKKFYEKRIKLCQKLSLMLTQITLALEKSKDFKEIELKVSKYASQLEQQNINIEESLKKLLKGIKKKIKKEYPQKDEQKHIQKHLHLDYTIQYESVIDEFILAYLQSLLEAKDQFPELTYHIVQIMEAMLVIKGRKIDIKEKQAIENSKNKSQKLFNTEAYYNILMKKKQIKALFQPHESKGKGKK